MSCNEPEQSFRQRSEAAPPRSARGVSATRPAATMPSCEQQVEALLHAHDRPGSFLESPRRLQSDATIDRPPIAERPGTQIGPYKLLQQIGEGGMGVVYMAEQTRAGQRRVALKIIKPGMDTPAGDRPLRGRAAGPGADGPSEHRQGARRGHDRQRPALLRDGAGQGHADHAVLRRAPPHAAPAAGAVRCRSARRSSTPIRRGSSTATSSRRTCWSPNTTSSRCPR